MRASAPLVPIVLALALLASAAAVPLLQPALPDLALAPRARGEAAIAGLDALVADGVTPLGAYAYARGLLGAAAVPAPAPAVDARAYLATLAPGEDFRALDALSRDAYEALGALLGAHAAASAAVARGATVAELEALRATVLDRAAGVVALRDEYRAGEAPIDVCDGVFLYFGDAPQTLACNYIVSVGGHGDDAYANRAGGAGTGEAALAIDLGGNDRYAGNFTTGTGINGGAHVGGFGALLDLAGDDSYFGVLFRGFDSRGNALWGHGGVNGGASRQSAGLLLDVAGNDDYDGQLGHGGVNGGASFGGSGALLDLAGADERFDGSVFGQSGGVNGGANDGSGLFFHCGSGDNAYTGFVQERGGVNGGGEQASGVFVSCGGRLNTYAGQAGGGGVNAGTSGEATAVFVHGHGDAIFDGRARYGGVNGGAYLGASLLVTGSGRHAYRGDLERIGGVNGGAVLGAGALVDLGADDDAYVARSPGTAGANGGGFFVATGLLFDAGGNDAYDAEVGGAATPELALAGLAGGGTNGRGAAGACALLVDLAGADRYRDDADAAWEGDGARLAAAPDCGARLDL